MATTRHIIVLFISTTPFITQQTKEHMIGNRMHEFNSVFRQGASKIQ